MASRLRCRPRDSDPRHIARTNRISCIYFALTIEILRNTSVACHTVVSPPMTFPLASSSSKPRRPNDPTPASIGPPINSILPASTTSGTPPCADTNWVSKRPSSRGGAPSVPCRGRVVWYRQRSATRTTRKARCGASSKTDDCASRTALRSAPCRLHAIDPGPENPVENGGREAGTDLLARDGSLRDSPVRGAKGRSWIGSSARS